MRRQIAPCGADLHARALLVVRARVAVERELRLVVPEVGGGRLQAVVLTLVSIIYLSCVYWYPRGVVVGDAAGAHAV